MTHTVIELDGLTKRYRDNVVLAGVDLQIGPGIFALLGPNGAGKTTLVDILSTLIRPDGGTARILGHDVIDDARAVRSVIGVSGQYAAVDEVLNGTENLVMIGRLLGLRPAAAHHRAAELLGRFDLVVAARRRVGTWSGGMRRRLDLAMTLVRPPQVVFLDEPTAGLDSRSRQTLWEEVRALAAAGSTVLLTTQYLDEADALADRVVVLDDGRVVADGTPDELKSQVGGEVVEVLGTDGQVVHELATDGTCGDLARVLSGVPAGARVTVRRPSLDQVFLQLTGDAAGQVEQGEKVPA